MNSDEKNDPEFHCLECNHRWKGSYTAIEEMDVQCPECGGYDVELDC